MAEFGVDNSRTCVHCWAKLSPIWVSLFALLAWWFSLPVSTQLQQQRLAKALEPIVQQTFALDESVSDKEDLAMLLTLVPAPDFARISLSESRKQAFIAWLLPLVVHENELIERQRSEAVKLYGRWQQGKLSLKDKTWLVNLALDYEVAIEDKGFNLGFWQNLMHRVDVIPPSLVLTQAAIESGWGTSRLAKEANNFFGMMCFRAGCGVKVPNAAGEFVRYTNERDGVAAYMKLLNIKGAYRSARMERMKNRLMGEVPSGLALAKTLVNYSELGKTYIKFLIKVMQDNHLEDYDGADVEGVVEMLSLPNESSLSVEVKK